MKPIKFCSILIVAALPLRTLAEDAQKTFNPIPVASPTLMVAPDARSSGMGDVGAATSPDASAQHWNAAKYAFSENEMGGVLGYSPWLRNLVPDVNIAYLSFFWKYREIEAVAATLRYFSLGAMQIVDNQGGIQSEASPYELAFDVAWTRKFGDNFSASLTARYIRSDLIGGVASGGDGGYGASMRPANAFSFDVGAYYQIPMGRDEMLAFGMTLTNLGTKINYSDEASGYFLPMNMRIGGRYSIPIDEDNHISFAVDLNKLLVPTPKSREADSTGTFNNSGNDMSVPLAILSSFADAPYGFTEELAEINFGLGAEYTYRKMLFGRAGFYYDSKRKGNRRYLTFGAGLKYNFMQLDIAYYVPFTNNDPMGNTVKLSLAMYLGELRARRPTPASYTPRRSNVDRPMETTPAQRRTPQTTESATPATQGQQKNTPANQPENKAVKQTTPEKKPDINVQNVAISSATMSLTVNATRKLRATISPFNATNKNVDWSTDNESVVSVDATGSVTAKAAGVATITVTTQDGGKTAVCTITVNASQRTTPATR
jgi:hypothetical protein